MMRFLSQLFATLSPGSNRPAKRECRLQLETLDERVVPSATVDLSTAGASGTIGGAVFQQGDTQPAGSGVIQSFVRIHALGGATAEQGYNTDARPLQFNENKSPTFTRSIQLSDIPLVSVNGVNYREFLLDINQKSSQPLVSLDQLQIFEGDSGNLTGYSGGQLAGISALYDMNAGGGSNWVELNARLSHGSGSSDMTLLVPDSYFLKADTSGNANPYVYLFSRFGDNFATNGGYEEWAVQKGNSSTPIPASLSGTITLQSGGPAAGIMVQLTGTDVNGNSVTLYAVTDQNGFYFFDNLAAGTYSLTVVQSNGGSDTSTAGNLGGLAGVDVSSITLGAGQNGLGYNFNENPGSGPMA
ncbi:MAG TPA: carboxypeptidase-like regulatory domain-containing protein [Gemmataceae bacterium]|nr:carboxypeptidase-like regulatory domain-containing protein [Gemmataceae bacterium]